MGMTQFEQALPSADSIRREVLDNGITVLVYEKPEVQSVVVTGSLPAGSLYDEPEKAGLADLTAETLTRGTQSRDFDTLYAELESIGADIETGAGRFKSSFDGKSLTEDLSTLLSFLGDVLRNPAFPEDQFERLRGETLTYLNYNLQNTRYLASRGFAETLYPEGHPLHYSNSGSIESVQAVTLDDVRDFHAKYYGPQGMIIVVVGSISGEAAVDAVREQFADWTNEAQPGMPAIPEAVTVEETRRSFTPVPGKSQSDLNMGFVGPSRHAEDYQAARLVNSVLGQFGMMGRIGKIVREEKGYAYYSRSNVSAGHGYGVWNAIAGVNPANVDETVTDITNEFARIASEPVSDEELGKVKSYYTGSLPLQLESNEGVANTLLRMEAYDLGLDFLVNYRDEIEALTPQDLLSAAQNYIDTDKLVVSVAGPGEG